MRIRTRLAIAAAALAAALAPGVAAAAPDTVINFDDLPAGAAPGHTYQASTGVEFGNPPRLRPPRPVHRPHARPSPTRRRAASAASR